MLKKRYLIAIGILISVLLIATLLLVLMNAPISKADGESHLNKLIEKNLLNAKDTDHAIVSIKWPSKGIDKIWAYEKVDEKTIKPMDENKPFHIASVGKTFTAVLIMKLQEEGKLSIDERLGKYLPPNVIEGLFTYKGIDYSKEVTIRQLLAHTSGIADYFGDPVTSGKTTEELIISEPETFWTPEMLLAISRDRQEAVSKPGEAYHYSDTGYILLGILIETINKKPLENCLEEQIFRPLEMDNSYLMFYGKPISGQTQPLSKIWFQGHEISQQKSLSVDWAGGGIISTASDLQKFNEALKNRSLISEKSYGEMAVFNSQFIKGIDYGLGLMSFDFEKFFFLLKGFPKLEGHMGILSCFVLHDPKSDLSLVMNFGSDTHNESSVKLMIEILQTLMRIKN